METVNIHQAKTHLSKLVERAAAGEEIIISKAGVPAARLVPFEAPQRKLGLLEDSDFTIPDDFDDPLPDDVLKLFEGR